MVALSPRLDDVFHALAHEARRDMLRRLTDHDLTVGELSAPLEMSLAAASKHVRILEDAGLISRSVQGRRHVCRLARGGLSSATEWLQFYEQYWHERLDALDALLEGQDR